MPEDYAVTCGNCGGDALEHQINKCEVCQKDVCLHCAGCTWNDQGCCDKKLEAAI